MAPVRNRGRRVSETAVQRALSLADQAVSSLTNFVAVVLMARHLSAVEFGLVSTLMAAIMLMIGLGRGFIGEPALTRLSPSGDGALAPLSAALLLGALSTAAAVAAALALAPGPRAAVLWLGVFAPVFVGQDALRFVNIARAHAGYVLISDTAWLITSSALYIWLGHSYRLTPAGCVAIFGLGCLIGLSILIPLAGRSQLRMISPAHWFRQTSGLGGYYAADYVARNVAPSLVLLAVAGMAGLAQAGGLRAAQALFGPVRVLLWSAVLAFVPSLRGRVLSGEAIRRTLRLLSVSLVAATVAVGAALAVLPTRAGSQLFGATWPQAHKVILPLTVLTAALAWNGATAVGFRAHEAARAGVRVRMVQEAGSVIGGVIGAWFGGAEGGAWGLATAAVLASVLWEIELNRLPQHG